MEEYLQKHALRLFRGTANGKTVKRGLRVKNSASGFEHLLTMVQFYMDRDGFKDVVFGLEPTSVYHKPLAEFLITHDHHLRIFLNGYYS